MEEGTCIGTIKSGPICAESVQARVQQLAPDAFPGPGPGRQLDVWFETQVMTQLNLPEIRPQLRPQPELKQV